MGLSEAILCLDGPFTGFCSHKRHAAGSPFNTVDAGGRQREEKTGEGHWWKNVTAFKRCSQSRKLAVIAIVTQSAEGCLPRYRDIITSCHSLMHTVHTVPLNRNKTFQAQKFSHQY